tara:strand:- start:1009 stop:1341 length:333 start_codon:yes stop_codon:yes gene_type:complete
MQASALNEQQILVIANMKIKLAEQEKSDFYRVTKTLIQKTIMIENPIEYTCCENINDPTDFTWNETWSSKSALDKHFSSDHVQEWLRWVQPRLIEPIKAIFVETTKTTAL